jgi:hypothetical protein
MFSLVQPIKIKYIFKEQRLLRIQIITVRRAVQRIFRLPIVLIRIKVRRQNNKIAPQITILTTVDRIRTQAVTTYLYHLHIYLFSTIVWGPSSYSDDSRRNSHLEPNLLF